MRDRGYPGVAWRFLEMFFEKSFQNIWKFQKYALSLHCFSALMKRISKKVLRKIF
jgi:hypothetical protein